MFSAIKSFFSSTTPISISTPISVAPFTTNEYYEAGSLAKDGLQYTYDAIDLGFERKYMDALFAMHDAYTNRASSLSTDLATYKGFFEQIISAREAKALVKKQEKDAYLAGLASTLAADDRIIKRERTVCSTEESLYTATLYHGINTGNSYNNRDNAQSNAASFIAGVGTMLVCATSSSFLIGNIGFKFVGEVKAITEFYTKNRSTSVGVRYVDGNDDKSPVFYSTEAACKAYSGSAEFLVVPTSIVGVWVDASASEADVALANTLASQLGVEVVRT